MVPKLELEDSSIISIQKLYIQPHSIFFRDLAKWQNANSVEQEMPRRKMSFATVVDT
jgi:hypothetical protein